MIAIFVLVTGLICAVVSLLILALMAAFIWPVVKGLLGHGE